MWQVVHADPSKVLKNGDYVMPSQVVDVSKMTDLKKKVSDAVQQILEDWVGTKLELTKSYGIRKYEAGTIV